jgi:hypothetical protein
MRTLLSAGLIIVLSACHAASACAGTAKASEPEKKVSSKSSEKPAESSARSNRTKELPAFTQEREAAAMTFVRMHHPELATLLEQLKTTNKAEYQRAIRDLFRTSERLAQAQERNPQRYELELEAWKINSRIQVLVARLVMSRDPAIEAQLREALFAQISNRKQQVEYDRQRMSTRLSELDSELTEINRDQSQVVEERLKKLINSSKRPATKKNEESKTKN